MTEAHKTPAPDDKALGEIMSIVRRLARCDKNGKDAETQDLIVEARKACGWPKKDLLR